MHKKSNQSWLKHLDFAVLDMVIMTIAYVVSCYLRYRQGIEFYDESVFPRIGFVLMAVYLVVIIAMNPYKNILRRNRYQELAAIFKQMVAVFTVFTVIMYITGIAVTFSRTVYVVAAILGYLGIAAGRIVHKTQVRKRLKANQKSSIMLIIADSEEIDNCLELIEKNEYNAFAIAGLVILDEDMTGQRIRSYPVVAGNDTLESYILSEVIDEIIICTGNKVRERELMDVFLEAGITVHKSMRVSSSEYPNAVLEKVGGQMVMTTSYNTVSGFMLALKRLMDIVGALIGLVITGIIYLFVAPQIKKADPGPAIFKQTRVGKNGRQFTLYKFRSMYMNAEEKKADLMDQNEMDGMMFKMENDPRILPGIGHKLRNTSLDEFPQFWNVLKGDMSLVGTRPPTIDEYAHYEAHHKMRLSFKPGLTGMWQISGRSDITDFEEVVRYDREYIKNWNIWLDISIIFKTILVVLKRNGAK